MKPENKLKEDAKIFKRLIRQVKKKGYTVNLPNDAMRGPLPIEKVIEYKIHYKFIFDHDFQKALFGDRFIDKTTLKPMVVKMKKKGRTFISMDNAIVEWQYYAAKLAVADDYLLYLKGFLN